MNFLKQLWPVLLSGLLALVFLFVSRTYLVYEEIGIDVSAWGSFFNVFGVLYAILVGFLIVVVLNRFGSLSSLIEDEINELEVIRDFTIYLDGQIDVVRGIKGAILNYVNSVLDREWELMADVSKPIDSDTSPELYGLIEAVHKVRITNESDGVALDNLAERVANITVLRTKRLDVAHAHLVPLLRLLLVFMSFTLVAGFSLMGVNNVWVHALMVLTLAVSMHVLSIVLADLNNPFVGTWNITKTSFQELSEKLKKSLEK